MRKVMLFFDINIRTLDDKCGTIKYFYNYTDTEYQDMICPITWLFGFI